MKFVDICGRLETSLYEACVDYIPRLGQELKGRQIYAFTILLSSYDSICIAANTVEALEKQVIAQKTLEPAEFRVPPIYLEMSSAEWDHMNGFREIMSPVDEILTLFRERHYTETGFGDLESSLNYNQITYIADQQFEQIIIRVLRRLKHEGRFSSHSFTDDVFLGVQYRDMGLSELHIIEAVSKQLNSQYWADKIVEFKTWMKEQSNE